MASTAAAVRAPLPPRNDAEAPAARASAPARPSLRQPAAAAAAAAPLPQQTAERTRVAVTTAAAVSDPGAPAGAEAGGKARSSSNAPHAAQSASASASATALAAAATARARAALPAAPAGGAAAGNLLGLGLGSAAAAAAGAATIAATIAATGEPPTTAAAAALRDAVAESKHTRMRIEARGDHTRQLQAALQAALDQITKIEHEFARFKAAAEHDRAHYAAVLEHNALLRTQIARLTGANTLPPPPPPQPLVFAIAQQQHHQQTIHVLASNGTSNNTATPPSMPQPLAPPHAALSHTHLQPGKENAPPNNSAFAITREAVSGQWSAGIDKHNIHPRTSAVAGASNLTAKHNTSAGPMQRASARPAGSSQPALDTATQRAATLDMPKAKPTQTRIAAAARTAAAHAHAAQVASRGSAEQSTSSAPRPFERALSVRLLHSDRGSSRLGNATRTQTVDRGGLAPVRRALSATLRAEHAAGHRSSAQQQNSRHNSTHAQHRTGPIDSSVESASHPVEQQPTTANPASRPEERPEQYPLQGRQPPHIRTTLASPDALRDVSNVDPPPHRPVTFIRRQSARMSSSTAGTSMTGETSTETDRGDSFSVPFGRKSSKSRLSRRLSTCFQGPSVQPTITEKDSPDLQ